MVTLIARDGETLVNAANAHRDPALEVVARHGGRVWADAAPGQGATFYFTLGDDSAP